VATRIAIALAVVAALVSPALAQAPAKDRMVVVISLDGFPGFSLDNPKLPIPTLRRLIRNGAAARMSTVNLTVTWPNHTTLVTGVRADEHGLLTNGTILPTAAWPFVKVEPMLDKEKMVHVPTVYDAAYQAGLSTAQVNWVAVNNAPTITWAFNEWASADGPLEREMISKGAVAAADLENFTEPNILFRDQIWTTAAVHLIREHKPNLLLFHLLSLDSVHHHYGPKTLAGTAAIAFLDSCVARVVDAVSAAGMDERTTFLVVSDHGFKPFTKEIRASVALKAAGLGSRVSVMAEGGSAYVYFNPTRAEELAPKAMHVFAGIEGIDQVIGPDGFAALGYPLPEEDPQMCRLLLTAKDGYAFSGATGGPVTAAVAQQGGSHGYLASDPDMDAIFIASGYGVSSGAKLDKIANIDVAPTVANLLGVALPTAKGKPIPLQ
jgi:predicted AlkP superfamily pyrophosphatase or phosphodiesterase